MNIILTIATIYFCAMPFLLIANACINSDEKE